LGDDVNILAGLARIKHERTNWSKQRRYIGPPTNAVRMAFLGASSWRLRQRGWRKC
jgi:hypothetical protein